MKINIIKYAFATLPLVTFSSCLDFDTPSDEFNKEKDVNVRPEPLHGDADNLEIKEIPAEVQEGSEGYEAFVAAKTNFAAAKNEIKNDVDMLITAQYYLMGGKDGNPPAEHQWQYVYSLTTDAYAGYTTCDQSWGGSFETTYSYKRDFCEGPHGRFLSMKNNLGNLLNNDATNNLVEIKAIGLLLFDIAAQECTDLYGSIAYQDHKSNKETNPFAFNDGYTIYTSIIKNIDDIVAVFDNFPNRPQWYKDEINSILSMNDIITQDKQISTWKRFANSIKLRMAMHLVKVDAAEAQRIAEEAVASGVVEDKSQEVGLNSTTNFFNAHPLKAIMSSWNDCRVNASFVSILSSLNHPYIHYLIAKNTDNIGDVEKNSGIYGLRAGVRMLNGQQYYANPRVAYSQFTGEDFEFMNIYAMKWAEVDFLRAEGALRGWAMGGTPQFFYERGIKNGDCGDRFGYPTGNYETYLDDYMAVETPTAYKYVDPMDSNNDIESVTKIGVKWNDSDDSETKLEKIITQKYIAIFPYSYEAWTDMRRTGYPKTFPVLNPTLGDGSLNDGDLIRRMPLPHGDLQAGHDDIANTGIAALGGPDKQATRVFWDKETPNF